MQITEDLILNIMKTISAEEKNIPKALADAINGYDNISKNIQKSKEVVDKARATWDNAYAQYESDLKLLRSRCDHPIFTHHTGYEDSYNICDICGKEL